LAPSRSLPSRDAGTRHVGPPPDDARVREDSANDLNAPAQRVPEPEAGSCANCGAAPGGPFCARCGQRALTGRHTVRGMAGGILARIVNLERGFFHTVARLTVAPGQVVRDYLGGRTVPYVHPFGYLLVTFALFVLLGELLGGARFGTIPSNRVLVILVVPFVAGASWVLFRRAGFHYAEHLILCTYVLGHMALLVAAMQPAVPLTEGRVRFFLAVSAPVVAVGYAAWAFSRVFAGRPLLAAAGGAASVLAGVVLWGIAMSAIVHVLRA
jgi:hypothetical protein